MYIKAIYLSLYISLVLKYDKICEMISHLWMDLLAVIGTCTSIGCLTGLLLFPIFFLFRLCLMSHWYDFSMFKCVKDKPEEPEGRGKKPSHQTKVI